MDEECLICGEKLEIVVIDDQVGKGIHEERICTNEFCNSHFDDSFFENLP